MDDVAGGVGVTMGQGAAKEFPAPGVAPLARHRQSGLSGTPAQLQLLVWQGLGVKGCGFLHWQGSVLGIGGRY